MPTRNQRTNHVPLKAIRGPAKVCAQATPEFRDKVAHTARQQGLSIQDYILTALRDKLAANRTDTIEHRRAIALHALYQNKRTPDYVRRMADALLDPFMPEHY